MQSYSETNNTGSVTATSGVAGRSGPGGGNADILSIAGKTKNTGNLNFSGGDAGEFGGDGGNVVIFGATTSNTGDISVNGGNATDATITTNEGGDGGGIIITGLGLDAASNKGTLSYTIGSGQVPENAEEGCAQVNITFEGEGCQNIVN